jgi:hypothetical protein
MPTVKPLGLMMLMCLPAEFEATALTTILETNRQKVNGLHQSHHPCLDWPSLEPSPVSRRTMLLYCGIKEKETVIGLLAFGFSSHDAGWPECQKKLGE